MSYTFVFKSEKIQGILLITAFVFQSVFFSQRKRNGMKVKPKALGNFLITWECHKESSRTGVGSSLPRQGLHLGKLTVRWGQEEGMQTEA